MILFAENYKLQYNDMDKILHFVQNDNVGLINKSGPSAPNDE